ncbi:MAG: DUF3034 family protein [Acidobacteria bacterium]|nr:DUF3034 family protein [Acidobacteriota bacterium]
MNIGSDLFISTTDVVATPKRIASFFLPMALLMVFSVCSLAQGLNWEGQTGAFITPFAYTSPSPADGIGHPNVAFHYLNTGSVIGNNFQGSITVGLMGRAEFGYTRSFVSAGDTTLSPLFKNGFNTVHGKVNFIPENVKKTKWVPGISAGFVARTQVRRVGGAIKAQDTTNGDIYLVATKVITQIPGLPILLNAGVKATNASIFGLAGNASAWQGRAFGAAAFVLKGPSRKSQVIVGSEFAQQPRHIQDLPGAVVPTTMTYFARIVPNSEKPFNIDFGIAQAAGKIAPGVDVKARAQFAMGITYRF